MIFCSPLHHNTPAKKPERRISPMLTVSHLSADYMFYRGEKILLGRSGTLYEPEVDRFKRLKLFVCHCHMCYDISGMSRDS